MIRDTIVKGIKITEVVLHCYTLTRNPKRPQWDYSEDLNPDPDDGKRHRIRSFVIAHDDNPFPNTGKLKSLLAIPTVNHSNIKNSGDYGSKLGGFCPGCLSKAKTECKKKFRGNW